MNEICLSCRKHTKCGRAKHETIGCGYYVQMTNKEYYTETDEELAGFLSRICRDLLASVVEDGGSVPNEYIEEDREFWLKWLKEIHHDDNA